MTLKFEQKRSRVWLELRVTVGRQHHFIEQVGIKEARIGLTGFHAIAHMTGEARDGDLLPHFATHLEVFGNLVEVTQKLISRGRSVERRVVSYRSEQWLVVVLILAILAVSKRMASLRRCTVASRADLSLNGHRAESRRPLRGWSNRGWVRGQKYGVKPS